MRAHRPWSAIVSVLVASLCAGCAHSSAGAPLTALGREHLRAPYRGRLEGTAVVLPVLDCTSTGVERIPNPPARDAEERIAAEVWRELGLPGNPDPDDAANLPERARLCRELSDNYGSGTNDATASPAMRELLRDFFTRHAERRWLVVAARWLLLDDDVLGRAPRRDVGIVEGRLYETDQLDVSLYVFSRAGDVAYRADLSCRGAGKGERHDCGAGFHKTPARVAELVDGFPRSVIERPAIVRTGGLIPMRRPPDPIIDLRNPASVKLADPAAPREPLAKAPARKAGPARYARKHRARNAE